MTMALLASVQSEDQGLTIAGNTQYIIFGSSFKNIVGTNQ